jgi:hypothetical protein
MRGHNPDSDYDEHRWQQREPMALASRVTDRHDNVSALRQLI